VDAICLGRSPAFAFAWEPTAGPDGTAAPDGLRRRISWLGGAPSATPTSCTSGATPTSPVRPVLTAGYNTSGGHLPWRGCAGQVYPVGGCNTVVLYIGSYANLSGTLAAHPWAP